MGIIIAILFITGAFFSLGAGFANVFLTWGFKDIKWKPDGIIAIVVWILIFILINS